jgi:hypothetical protein
MGSDRQALNFENARLLLLLLGCYPTITSGTIYEPKSILILKVRFRV